MKDAPQSDSGSHVPSYLNGTSFDTSIRNSSEKNNPQNAEDTMAEEVDRDAMARDLNEYFDLLAETEEKVVLSP